MSLELTLFLISALVSLSVGFLWVGWKSSQTVNPMRDRLAMYISTPMTIDEMELSEPLSERILKPALRKIIKWLGHLTPTSNVDQIRRQITIAGNPGNLTPIDFVGLKLFCGICVGLLTTAYFFAQNIVPAASIVLGIGGFAVGQHLPNFWLKGRIKKRKQAIARALPDALDMLTICVDAGLGFDAALLKVSEKWEGPLSEEMSRVVSEIRVGVRRSEALRHMAERTDVPEVQAFIAVLIQADRLGVSIADILHAQSQQLRVRRRQWAEEQARKAPVKMLFPLVLFIFPALFAVILGPAIPRIMEAFGNVL
ncbi:MAG: type II secretion system F family protein [Anaerolineae bacterium]